MLRRGAITADFLPLEATGARAFLDAARRRGLVRPLDELIAEREANERALSSDVTIRVAAPQEYDRVRAAYAAWGYDGGVAPADVIYLAERGAELTGIVRRTREHGVTMLRGMQVAPTWRRRRIGTRLLRAFVADLRGEECYCVPYTHLITFYGAAGFGALRDEVAPPFLRERLTEYRARGLDVLVMRRPAGARAWTWWRRSGVAACSLTGVAPACRGAAACRAKLDVLRAKPRRARLESSALTAAQPVGTARS